MKKTAWVAPDGKVVLVLPENHRDSNPGRIGPQFTPQPVPEGMPVERGWVFKDGKFSRA